MNDKEKNIDEIIIALKRLIPEATQGKWWIDSHGSTMVSFTESGDILEVFVTDPEHGDLTRHEGTGNLSRWRNDVDATYIATANPKNIQQLLSEISTLRYKLRQAQDDAADVRCFNSLLLKQLEEFKGKVGRVNE